MGQAAGTAAHLALKDQGAVADVGTAELRTELESEGACLTL
jgi:hypothetical protein